MAKSYHTVTRVVHPDGATISVETEELPAVPVHRQITNTHSSSLADSLFFSFVPCHFAPAPGGMYYYTAGCTSYATDDKEVADLKLQAISLRPTGVSAVNNCT